MTRLNGQDRASCGEIGCAHDVGCGTQVRADTYTFEDRGQHNERFGVRGWVRIGTFLDRGVTGFLDSTGQESYVGLLIQRNLLQIAVESRVKTRGSKVGLRVICKTFAVELVL